MSNILYFTSGRFTKFFVLDLFTDNLVPCSEDEFNDIVIRFRSIYDMQYDGYNAQNFFINGHLEARRER